MAMPFGDARPEVETNCLKRTAKNTVMATIKGIGCSLMVLLSLRASCVCYNYTNILKLLQPESFSAEVKTATFVRRQATKQFLVELFKPDPPLRNPGKYAGIHR